MDIVSESLKVFSTLLVFAIPTIFILFLVGKKVNRLRNHE